MTAITNLIIGKGIDNLHDKFQFGEVQEGQLRQVDALSVATNVDLDDVGLAKRRDGYARVMAVSNPHSLWVHPQDNSTAYYVVNGVLRKLNANYTSTFVANLSSNNRVSYTVINGEVVITNGTDIGWLVGSTYIPFSQSITDHFERLTPAGQYCTYFRGCLFVAKGNVIYISKPYNVEVMDERFSQIPLDSYVRMLAPVEDGIWVGTSKHVGFISGKGQDEFEYVNRSDFVPPDGCFGTRYARASEGAEMVAYWVSEGFIEGRASGEYKNVSSPLVRIPSADSGYCFFRENNGYYQYLAILKNETDNNIFVADVFPEYGWSAPLHVHLNALQASFSDT